MHREWARCGFAGGAEERQGSACVDQMERDQQELPVTASTCLNTLHADAVHVADFRCPHSQQVMPAGTIQACSAIHVSYFTGESNV